MIRRNVALTRNLVLNVTILCTFPTLLFHRSHKAHRQYFGILVHQKEKVLFLPLFQSLICVSRGICCP